jgi:hypothetical protein
MITVFLTDRNWHGVLSTGNSFEEAVESDLCHEKGRGWKTISTFTTTHWQYFENRSENLTQRFSEHKPMKQWNLGFLTFCSSVDLMFEKGWNNSFEQLFFDLWVKNDRNYHEFIRLETISAGHSQAETLRRLQWNDIGTYLQMCTQQPQTVA